MKENFNENGSSSIETGEKCDKKTQFLNGHTSDKSNNFLVGSFTEKHCRT